MLWRILQKSGDTPPHEVNSIKINRKTEAIKILFVSLEFLRNTFDNLSKENTSFFKCP